MQFSCYLFELRSPATINYPYQLKQTLSCRMGYAFGFVALFSSFSGLIGSHSFVTKCTAIFVAHFELLTISHLYTKDKIPFRNVLSTRCSPLISDEGSPPRISPTLSSPELELRSPATINCPYQLKQTFSCMHHAGCAMH